ncbi:MAG: hypothetical protein LBJ73_03210 [Rickettsiales bacterium]|jgi:hypothetical protein|nr:hypothetical protein [Rickettsiales bacterium]
MWHVCQICTSLIFSFITIAAHADIASVEYVHNTIFSDKNITVPVADGVDINNVCSIRYLYEQIDQANQILNATTTTNYADSIGAFSNNVVSSLRAQSDIQNLIKCTTLYCAELPPTITLANCTYNTPSIYLSDSIACLGVENTVGHWELVSSYTGADGDEQIKKAGSVPPGLYRVESYNSYFGLGTSIILTNKTMYYGHSDSSNELTSRLFLSVKNPFTVGQLLFKLGKITEYCNWNFIGYISAGISCYLGDATTGLSLDQSDGMADWILGYMTPGITPNNTKTPLRASKIYRWVNNQ